MDRTLSRTWLMGVVVIAAGLVAATPADAAPTDAAAAAASVPATCNGIAVTIFGTDGNDTITGTNDSDIIATGDGDDVVFGLDRQDTVCLGQGNDRFVGGSGADAFVAEATVDGSDVFEGDGSDIVSYAARSTGVTITLDGIANDGQAGENDNVGLAAVLIVGGAGNDVLNGAFAAVNGGAGDDQLTSNQSLFGEAGNDTLTHIGGLRSAMEGGDGGDRMVEKGTGGATMAGGAGNDSLVAGSTGTNLRGGVGNDRITGGPGGDFINGDDGNDLLIGGLGNDRVSGDAGDDRYLADVALDGSDTFDGGAGNDTTDFQKRDNLSHNTALSLSASGVAGDDGEPGEGDTMTAENIRGGTGRNVIFGDGGRNRLEGGRSADVINSIDGIGRNDVIIGNPDRSVGIDTCQFDAGPPPDDVVC
jgi:Ca2+-binding RTX toxin-like protein